MSRKKRAKSIRSARTAKSADHGNCWLCHRPVEYGDACLEVDKNSNWKVVHITCCPKKCCYHNFNPTRPGKKK